MAQAAPKISFVSLGCPKALVDSERIITQLRAEGYELTKTHQGADAVIVNTCGFLDSAKAESLDAIGAAMAENGKVIVTGQDADLAACQRIVAGTQTMTVYKPLTQLAKRAAELAVKLAQRKPFIAKAETDNGKIAVPSVLLDIVAVTKDNIRETVVADGFRKEAEVFQR